jgi:hypothetical protein
MDARVVRALRFDRLTWDIIIFIGSEYEEIICSFAALTVLVMGCGAAQTPATSVAIGRPTAVATDAAGNLYFAATNDCGATVAAAVFKLDAGGALTRVAGNGSAAKRTQITEEYPPASGEGGPATSAQLLTPVALALDAAGYLYIADGEAGRVRKVSPEGIITTVAGGVGLHAYKPEDNGDGGPATSAHLFYPHQLAVDAASNVYIGEWNTSRVRKVSADGTIDTVVGTGKTGYSGDGGLATSAEMGAVWGLAADGTGNLYISDNIPGDDYAPVSVRIRKVSADGVITILAGSGAPGDSPDMGDGGPATSAQFMIAGPLAVDASGNLYIADYRRIRRVGPDGVISTLAGTGEFGFSGDEGPAIEAKFVGSFYGPVLAADPAGSLYLADDFNKRVRKISADGIITTVAGDGSSCCCLSENAGARPRVAPYWLSMNLGFGWVRSAAH